MYNRIVQELHHLRWLRSRSVRNTRALDQMIATREDELAEIEAQERRRRFRVVGILTPIIGGALALRDAAREHALAVALATGTGLTAVGATIVVLLPGESDRTPRLEARPAPIAAAPAAPAAPKPAPKPQPPKRSTPATAAPVLDEASPAPVPPASPTPSATEPAQSKPLKVKVPKTRLPKATTPRVTVTPAPPGLAPTPRPRRRCALDPRPLADRELLCRRP